MECDVAIVGAGLAGLVAACELADRGRQVTILEQEGRQSLCRQALWSPDALFMGECNSSERIVGRAA